MRHPARKCQGHTGRDHRRSVARLVAPAAEGLGRRGSTAMRLLPVGADHEGRRAAEVDAETHARRDREPHERQHLPLRDLPPHHRRDPARIEGGLIMDRRDFLKVTGGLTFAFAFPAIAQANTAAKPINAWVRITPDGTVTILSTGAEMGQGSMTSLPLILADEMDADWSKVKIDWAPADPTNYGYTFQNSKAMAIVGSRAVMLYYNDLRTAGAQVRKVLIANAADKWGVSPASLKTEPGFVVDGSGRKMSYGEIAQFARVPSPLPAVEKSELKDKSQFRYIGKPMPRRDTPLKVNGTAQYAIDVDLPGMVYATVRHTPVHGGTPESWNEAKVKSMRGVIGIVKLPDGVAVLADSLPHAMAARQALEVKWNKGAADGFNSE